jgi:Uma2 family endonuclease
MHKQQQVDIDKPRPRHRWTVADYHKMGEVGLLAEDARVELIEGEIVEMAPIGSPHGGKVKRLIHLFNGSIGGKAIVAAQDPVILGNHSEPQPDIALLKWRDDYYEKAHPQPEDVFLVIEVSDSTVRYDRDVKIPLYARHGIMEAWLLDIPNRGLEVYRNPQAGKYQQMMRYTEGQLAPLALPEAMLDVVELVAGY